MTEHTQSVIFYLAVGALLGTLICLIEALPIWWFLALVVLAAYVGHRVRRWYRSIPSSPQRDRGGHVSHIEPVRGMRQ